jgi:ankyrin repeat protein
MSEISEMEFDTLLFEAWQGNTEVVLEAVDKNKNLATIACVNRGRTLLHEACRGGHVELARGLITCRASVMAQDLQGCDATWLALAEGNVALVTLLLDNGGDANTRTKCGTTALGATAHYGHLDVCLLLLSRGADLTAVIYDGRTALEWYDTGVIRYLSPEFKTKRRDILLAAWHAGPHPSQR